MEKERAGIPKEKPRATEAVAAGSSASSSKAVAKPAAPKDENVLTCKHCQAAFPTADRLDAHLLSKSGLADHPVVDWQWGSQFPCSYCPTWFKTAKGLKDHIWSKAGEGKHPTEAEQEDDDDEDEYDPVWRFNCLYCKKKFKSEPDMSSHLWSKQGEGSHPAGADDQKPLKRRTTHVPFVGRIAPMLSRVGFAFMEQVQCGRSPSLCERREVRGGRYRAYVQVLP